MKNNAHPEFLTTEEVAEIFGISRTTVLRWTKKNVLLSIRPTNGKYLFPADQELIKLYTLNRGIHQDGQTHQGADRPG